MEPSGNTANAPGTPDPVAGLYDRWIYPAPVTDLTADLFSTRNMTRHLRELFHAYWPAADYREDLDILIAGCGSNVAAAYAFMYPKARVTGIDISRASLDCEEQLQRRHQLSNLSLHLLPVERVAELKKSFDLIICHGVIHHLADPVAGLRALGQVLRPDGVIALMVYSQYMRLGVYMLQDLFRLMGLGLDDQSVALVKETLGGVSPNHPVRQYLRRAYDLQSDNGLVDTFLHMRDKPYTVADCLSLVDGAQLVFQGWDENGFYYPEGQIPASSPLRAAFDRLAPTELWKAMELFSGNIPNHWFYACRAERNPRHYRIQLEDEAFLNYVPVPRAQVVSRAATAAGQELVIARPPYPQVRLDALQSRIFMQLDGRRSAQESIRNAGPAGDPKLVMELARQFFRMQWRLGYMQFRLSSES